MNTLLNLIGIIAALLLTVGLIVTMLNINSMNNNIKAMLHLTIRQSTSDDEFQEYVDGLESKAKRSKNITFGLVVIFLLVTVWLLLS